MKYLRISNLLVVFSLLFSCSDEPGDYSPKPRGYFRIQLPDRDYRQLQIDCPYTFEYNQNAEWQKDRRECWGDIYYPELKARLQLTYKPVTDQNRDQLLQEGRDLAYKHTVKAAGIGEKLYTNEQRDVYGILYDIKGEAATNTQFFMTDSTNHFLRGVLYFYAEPNVDSLQPVNEYMYQEIAHLIETLQWQNSSQ